MQTKREVLAGDRLLPVEGDTFEQSLLPRVPSEPVDGSIIEVVEGVTQIGQYQVVVLNLGARDGIGPGDVLAVHQKGAVIVDTLQRDPYQDLPTPSAVIETDPARQGGFDGLSVAVDRTLREAGRGLKRTYRRVFPNTADLEVALPDERAGTILVFRSFDRISYALVMDAERAMHIQDIVTNP